jgi:hypothetical protein
MKDGEEVPLAPSAQRSDPLDWWVEPTKDMVTVGGRIDAVMERRIEEVIQSRRTRFMTKSDFLRAAVFWFMAEVVTPRMEDGRFTADIQLAAAATHRAQRIARISDATKFTEEAATAMRKLALQDALDDAAELWRDTWEAAEQQAGTFRTRAHKMLMGDESLTLVRRHAVARGVWFPTEEKD